MEEKDAQKKVAELQMMEQKLQGFLMQKQTFQGQFLELENALHESKGSEEVYKIVGQIVVKSEKDKLVKELEDKKDLLDKKIKEIEKQEEKMREEIMPLQEEVMKSLKNDK
ncbi:prefoldin subunit beta [Candidatus Woesearchaeota archaeon]|jgi:prefoldin beta subunit|nr:prefoldin subunit beta [Candidatus Woesearchaeota archaeon]MBT4322197.1 prefoldin subunit beta [Candidatus Woesearchaeota archaeon]MBT4631217.1 prefoldin subunit beta [Candidatus Woesearchaeota archaeon]